MLFLFTALTLSLYPKHSRIQKKDIDGFACKICKGLAEGAKVMIDQGMTINEITTKLLSQCQIIAQSDKAYYPMCQELSTKYVQILVHLVQENIESDKICVKLGYCSDLTSPLFRKTVRRNLHYLNQFKTLHRKL